MFRLFKKMILIRKVFQAIKSINQIINKILKFNQMEFREVKFRIIIIPKLIMENSNIKIMNLINIL
jgi:hypothetical protein